ncbi:hypothetical protein R1flu_027841 [Riccia fluitans]|uniref:Uncharacterized protein n=1 Tax=Riccia fluitans TaxID=41844 RepID=A0ABD1XP08_9MARC
MARGGGGGGGFPLKKGETSISGIRFHTFACLGDTEGKVQCDSSSPSTEQHLQNVSVKFVLELIVNSRICTIADLGERGHVISALLKSSQPQLDGRKRRWEIEEGCSKEISSGKAKARRYEGWKQGRLNSGGRVEEVEFSRRTL